MEMNCTLTCRSLFFSLAISLVGPAAAAGSTGLGEDQVSPYVGGMLSAYRPLSDSTAINTATQLGQRLFIGLPIDSAVSFEIGAQTQGGGAQGRGYGLGANLVIRDPDARPGLLLIAGIGVATLDRSRHSASPYAEIGTGIAFPLSDRLRLRGDVRVDAVRDNSLARGRDLYFESWLNFGLEFALKPTRSSHQPVCSDASCPAGQPSQTPALIDSDGDSVPDLIDRCPDTPAGSRVDEFGCPLAHEGLTPAVAAATLPPVVAPSKESPSLQSSVCTPPKTIDLRTNGAGCLIAQVSQVYEIAFGENGTLLTPTGRNAVDELARLLVQQNQIQLTVISHTDALGSQSDNLMLSMRRANLIRDRLISLGVNSGRIKAEGLGEFDPIAPNATEGGRARNERIEMRLSLP